MLKLQFADQRQPALWLVDPRITLGRDKSNSIVVDDEGVSIFHAEIRNEDGKLWLVDCGSINGTFLNDHRLSEKAELKAGDVVRLHTVNLQVVSPQSQLAGAAAAPAQPARAEPVASAPAWQLKALTGSISGRMFPIASTQIVGRDPSCDIAVIGSHVSRRHAEFTLRGGRLWVKDLGSSNGTFVNGKRAEESALSHGDEVKCDAMTFRVVGPQVLAEAAPEEDMEATMFRPAIQIPAKPAAAPSAPAPAATSRPAPVAAPASAPVAARPAPASAPQPAPQASPAPAPAPQGMGLGAVIGIMVVVTALAVGAALVLFK